jgi:hypothetical protein
VCSGADVLVAGGVVQAVGDAPQAGALGCAAGTGAAGQAGGGVVQLAAGALTPSNVELPPLNGVEALGAGVVSTDGAPYAFVPRRPPALFAGAEAPFTFAGVGVTSSASTSRG